MEKKAEELINGCKELGLFIVPVGEIEGWMDFGVRKNRWALPALEKIYANDCPANLADFVGSIADSIYGEYSS